jgi:hypothetical protein
MIKWITANSLALNADIKYNTGYNDSPQYSLSIGYKGKYTEESVNIKFLCLQIDQKLNWTKY